LVGSLLAAVARRGVLVREVRAGARLGTAGGCWRLDVLWPPVSVGGSGWFPDLPESSAENNASLVLRLDAGGAVFLLVGDLEETGETVLLEYLAAAPGAVGSPGDGAVTGGSAELNTLDASVLKVGHHGSPYSTSPALLAGVTPEIAVVSVGRNSFGHPSARTLERLEEAGAVVFVTRDEGAVSIRGVGQVPTQLIVSGFLSGRTVIVPIVRGGG